MDDLNYLNNSGRAKLAELRKDIETLEQFAKDHSDGKLMADVESHRLQLSRYDHSYITNHTIKFINCVLFQFIASFQKR